ncbi:MAG: sucrose synthase [Thermoguttaceae bacterium]
MQKKRRELARRAHAGSSAPPVRNRHSVASEVDMGRIAPTRRRRAKARPARLPVAPDLPQLKRFCYYLGAQQSNFFLTDQIQTHLERFLQSDGEEKNSTEALLHRLLRGCQEVVRDANYTYFLLRPRAGTKHIVRLHPEQGALEEVSREQYLQVKDTLVQGPEMAARRGLVIDFRPFFAGFPRVNTTRDMGAGISFLNRHLSGQMYQNPEVFRQALVQFLQDCQLNGVSILVANRLESPDLFIEELGAVENALAEFDAEVPYDQVAHPMLVHGFEAGWGRTVGTIRENLALLAQVLDSADPVRFERFLARLPLVRTVLMVSPHGWFAQDAVLGRPDTGGQVTYVLDQTRALENRLIRLFEESGIDAAPKIVVLTRLIPNADGTTCGVPREKIHGTQDCWIVRVPFRDPSGEVVPDWISRFHIWPYLESFGDEARQVVVTELLGRPDLIIGHYSDGNLVAHRLAEDLETTHCAAVHALEKTKYLLSDMHWADMEKDYHFSLQFTADLIAYNSADYIISSSYREIGGTNQDMGMFEAYETFSMPGLYRVISGMDPKLARHNIVPPGASEEYFFPFTDRARRVEAMARRLAAQFLSAEPGENAIGTLANPDLPPVFAMARMDRIKNLGGLAEVFGKHAALRQSANLFIISSITDPARSSDQEEIVEIRRMYELMDAYGLHGHVRWCAARLNKVETGEIYRVAADLGGVFAQPAFMETFGLTVIEAMACGLPVVVTCFGGPSEIVIDGQSGAVRDPNDHASFGDALHQVVSDRPTWDRFSQQGIARVHDAFTWSRHADRILQLSNVYSYWNYLDVMNRPALDQYIETLYHTVYRPRLWGQ